MAAADGTALAGEATSATALYIEDNPTNIQLVTRLIAGRWPRVELLAVHDAELGLELARRKVMQLVLMDINPPGMNGFEALAAPGHADRADIRGECQRHAHDIEKGNRAGFDAYLTKPLHKETFLSALGTVLATRC